MSIAIRERLDEEEGFTLIELLVVVIIIGILAAIAIPTFLNQRQKGYDSAAKSDLRNAAIAQEAAYTEGGSYQADEALLTEYKPTDLVDLNVVSASATGYCMEAIHENSTQSFVLDSTTNRVEEGTCGP